MAFLAILRTQASDNLIPFNKFLKNKRNIVFLPTSQNISSIKTKLVF